MVAALQFAYLDLLLETLYIARVVLLDVLYRNNSGKFVTFCLQPNCYSQYSRVFLLEH